MDCSANSRDCSWAEVSSSKLAPAVSELEVLVKRFDLNGRGALAVLMGAVVLVISLIGIAQLAHADFLAVNSKEAFIELRARVQRVGSIERSEAELTQLIQRQIRMSIGPLRRRVHAASWSPSSQIEWHARGQRGDRAWAEYTLRSQVVSHNQNGSELELVWVTEPERAERQAFWTCRRRFLDLPTWYHMFPRRSWLLGLDTLSKPLQELGSSSQ
jgi:hypothetical protein